MKRYGNIHSQIWDIENIKLAHKNARRGKTHYEEVKAVDDNEEQRLNEISVMLRDLQFVNSPYEVFTKRDKGKLRTIYKLPYFPDRIIHHAIMKVLEPIWKPILIADTFQSIKGRGIHKAKSRVQPVIRKQNVPYCLKFDIAKFYPSINNEILKTIIRKKIKCKPTLQILDTIIDSTTGVPIGNYLSQYFGNLYLSYFDHWVKETLKAKYYYRYCDDIVILSDSKQELHFFLGHIKKYLQNELQLNLKEDYQIFPTYIRGLDFLGLRFFKSYTLLRKNIATNFKRSVIHLTKDNISSRIPSIVSYYGWIRTSDSYNLWNTYVTKKIIRIVRSVGIKNKIMERTYYDCSIKKSTLANRAFGG